MPALCFNFISKGYALNCVSVVITTFCVFDFENTVDISDASTPIVQQKIDLAFNDVRKDENPFFSKRLFGQDKHDDVTDNVETTGLDKPGPDVRIGD